MLEITKERTNEEIGAMIRQYRKQHKLSMADVGVKVLGKVSKDSANSWMQRIEAGLRSSLKEADVLKIIDALGLTKEEFLAIELKGRENDQTDNPLLDIHPDMADHLEALRIVQKINNPDMIALALAGIQDLIGQAIDEIREQKKA